MIIHVECLPDETLVKKLGITKKQVKHHLGKSRIFTHLHKSENQLAIVDQDPGQAQPSYQKMLVLQKDLHGIKYYTDPKRNNKVFELNVKLEDWIIAACKKSKIDLKKDFSLPERPNDLHDVINNRLSKFEDLLDRLLKAENEAIMTLKSWINLA